MIRVTVAPELVLDDEIYEAARAALSTIAPEQVAGFTWEFFIDRKSWVRVPDVEHPDEPFYKAECVIKHGPPYLQTPKLNVWRSPDLRRDGAPMPHSHPWPFEGNLLFGGYEERRIEVRSATLLANPHEPCHLQDIEVRDGCLHQAGDINKVSLTTFHEVTRILEPGRTVSLMNCGRGIKDGWGYLDLETGLYTPNKLSETDARFKLLLLERNEHLR